MIRNNKTLQLHKEEMFQMQVFSWDGQKDTHTLVFAGLPLPSVSRANSFSVSSTFRSLSAEL